jgi:branched-chain amino acid transport system ATP-binding protein
MRVCPPPIERAALWVGPPYLLSFVVPRVRRDAGGRWSTLSVAERRGQPDEHEEVSMPQETLLQTRSLTKEFRGFRAVSDVDLVVRDGTVHALVGPNGAGKTTLFNLLTGFLSPTSGSIEYAGQDITGKRPEDIAHLGIARSFQITSLFDALTLREHLELALASPTGLGMRFWQSAKRFGRFEDRATALLDRVGLADRAGLPAGSLAYGQKRALELAIALVKQVSEGRTVVLVDHNMHVVGSLADIVTVLQSGSILAEGPYEQVRQDDRVIEAYLGQSAGDGHG